MSADSRAKVRTIDELTDSVDPLEQSNHCHVRCLLILDALQFACLDDLHNLKFGEHDDPRRVEAAAEAHAF